MNEKFSVVLLCVLNAYIYSWRKFIFTYLKKLSSFIGWRYKNQHEYNDSKQNNWWNTIRLNAVRCAMISNVITISKKNRIKHWTVERVQRITSNRSQVFEWNLNKAIFHRNCIPKSINLARTIDEHFVIKFLQSNSILSNSTKFFKYAFEMDRMN